MKRVLATIIVGILCLAPLGAVSKWTAVANNLEESIYFLEVLAGTELQGSCTAFMINQEKKHVLTAAHCDGEKILIDGTPTYRVFKDERKDLMVLRANGVDGPNVKLAPADADRGDEVASMGYGAGLEDPMFRIAHVSNVRMDIEGLSGPFVMIDAGFVGGQSGGPVVNDKGELVMIVQRGNDSLGIGVGAEVIRDKVGKYFAK